MIPVEHVAMVCHEANRAYQFALGEQPSPPWDQASQHIRDSAVDGVYAAMRGFTPEESHVNWLEFKADDGWTYGEVKDEQAKTHPCMVPYDDLPLEQRLKDRLFLAVVDALAVEGAEV